MNSAVKPCTEIKKQYDQCYATWFAEFLNGKTNDQVEMCATLFKAYQTCLKMDACQELKNKYDACFNYWFAEKFLKGDNNDEMCAELLKLYTNCVRKGMKDLNIEIKEMNESDFGLDDDFKSTNSSHHK